MKTGKVNQVAALGQALLICNAHGASYNPSKPSLQPTALGALLELAQEKHKAVKVALTDYALAVNAREESFEGLSKLATRVYRMVIASGASPLDTEEVLLIKRRFAHRGKKKPKLPSPDTLPENTNEAQTKGRISYQDYVSQLDTLERLITVLKGIPSYKPNEPELSVNALEAKLAELEATCQAVRNCSVTLSRARVERDHILNGPEGVLDTTRQFKAYVTARFGFSSPEARQISRLSLT